MKKTTITVTLCLLALMTTAQNQENQSQQLSEITSEQVKPELVETVEGIEVYYLKSQNGPNTMLDIEFKNTTKKPVSFYWTIIRENGLTYKASKMITIKAGKSISKEAALEMKGSHDFSTYPINITTK